MAFLGLSTEEQTRVQSRCSTSVSSSDLDMCWEATLAWPFGKYRERKSRARGKMFKKYSRNIDSGMLCHMQRHIRGAQSCSPALERQAFHKEREPRALSSIKHLFDSRLLSKNLDGNSVNLMGAKPRINYPAARMETCAIRLLLMLNRAARAGQRVCMAPLSLPPCLGLPTQSGPRGSSLAWPGRFTDGGNEASASLAAVSWN